MIPWLSQANRLSDWSQIHAVVAGIGVSGFSIADALLQYGARVTVLDEAASDQSFDKAKLLEILGAEVRLGPGTTTELPECDLLLTSPGWPPSAPLIRQAQARQIPIWGDVELAWRLQQPDRVVPWLGVTGTNGKTTTVTMLESILRAAGLNSCAVGNIGRPILETILDEVTYDVLAVELSSFQLHWVDSLSLHSAVVLNVDPDHLQWYEGESPTPFDAYAADKARIYHQVTHSCLYNLADPRTEQMVVDADVVEGARAIGITLTIPQISMLGVVDDVLIDRAFIPQRRDSALELISVADLPSSAPHIVEDALAAAGLARSFGIDGRSVRDGLRTYQLGPHRIQTVAVANGVTWVDDSKATNAHAASASLQGFDSVVWIAGGQAKGTQFEDLVRANSSRIKAAVLIGVDRGVVEAALRTEAPEIPVVSLEGTHPSVMVEAVRSAGEFARAGDTVLMAPACASQDIYIDYAERGEWYAKAIEEYIGQEGR